MLWTQSQKQHVHETARLRIKAGRFPNPRAGSRLTSDKSRVRESRTPGSVRGDRGNPLPYRDLRVLPALTHSRRGETVHSMTCVLRAKNPRPHCNQNRAPSSLGYTVEGNEGNIFITNTMQESLYGSRPAIRSPSTHWRYATLRRGS